MVEDTTRQAQRSPSQATLEHPLASFYEPHSNTGNPPLNTFGMPTGPMTYTPHGHWFGQYTGTGEVITHPADLPIWPDHAAGSLDVRGLEESLFDDGVATTNESDIPQNVVGS